MAGTTPPFALARYLEVGIASVEGWLWPTAAAILADLLVRQAAGGLRGDVCEIGVHHGKLFLVLANAALDDERAVAVDIFADQDKNVDRSGAGDRAILERHIARYAPAARVDIIEQSSLELEAEGFLARRFRFLSIDGGHTEAITANDLRLAERTLLPDGVAALDDVLNADWTGVLSGLARYLNQAGSLVPAALIPNKLLLATDADAAARCRAWLRASFPLALAKQGLEFFGASIDSYVEHPYYVREAQAGLVRECADLRQANQSLSQANEALRLRLADAQARAAEETTGLQARIAELAGEAARLRASTSWRLTGPLRGVGRFAKRR